MSARERALESASFDLDADVGIVLMLVDALDAADQDEHVRAIYMLNRAVEMLRESNARLQAAVRPVISAE